MQTVQAIGLAQDAVKRKLRDPSSAQFRNMGVFHPAFADGPPQAVCGEVNSKNGFGGYSGYTIFVWAALDENLKVDRDGTARIGDEARQLLGLCHDNAK